MGQEEETLVRDRLAWIRTELANERTILAYGRTAVAFGAAGIGLVHLFESPALIWLGWASIGLAILTLFMGVARFGRARRKISNRYDASGSPSSISFPSRAGTP